MLMPGTIEFTLDDAAKLLRLTIIGEVHDEQALREIEAYWQAHPQTVGYDSIVDSRRDESAVSWHGIGRLAERWHSFARAGNNTGGRTALIARDDAQRKMAELIAVKFPDREFEVFYSPDDALRWLKG
jgi:hypothetical protein